MHRTLLILSIIMGNLLCLLFPAMAQSQPSNIGIFTATADWGLEPHFPPVLNETKLPGKIEVLNATASPIYDIYGNGVDIGVQQTSDEAFYVYNQQNDSFQISGKFKFLGLNQNSRTAQTGFMVRQNAMETSSPYFAVVLNYRTRVNNLNIESKWRLPSDTEAHFMQYYDLNGDPEGTVSEEIYLRLTFIKPKQTVFSEWSYDGLHWHWMHDMHINVGDTPAIGIFIHNVDENEHLAHAQVSDVQLSKPLTAERQFSANNYSNGDIIDVTLTINNHTTSAQDVVLTELLPENTKGSDFTHSARIVGGTVTWELTLMPGEHHIRYKLQPLPSADGFVPLTGYCNSLPTFGPRLITNQYSIFDQYADLGLPEFRSSDLKAKKGSVFIQSINGQTEYQLQGHGRLGSGDQEGMYLYTEKEGSWQLTANLKWMTANAENIFAKMGISIREMGNQSKSKNFSANLLSQGVKFLGTSSKHRGLEINWQNGLNNNIQFWNAPEEIKDSNLTVFDKGKGLFVRLTRVLPLNLFQAEWSHDGEQWNLARQEFISMQDKVAYGLQIGNAGGKNLSSGKYRNVSLQPAPVMMTRTFSQESYKNGDSVRVTVIVYTPPGQEKEFVFNEMLPRRWKVISAGRNGKIKRNTIEWSITNRFPLSFLTYTTSAPLNTGQNAVFSATIDGEKVTSNDTLTFQRISPEQSRHFSVEQGVYVAVPLTLALLHILLFFFYPAKPENLYYAIFTTSVALVAFTTYQSYFFSNSPNGNDEIGILVVLSLCIMLRFFYSLVYDKFPLWMWFVCFAPFIIVFLLIVWIILSRRFELPLEPSNPIIYMCVAPAVFILMKESIRVLRILYCKKEEGYTILITGMAIMLILIQYVLFWGLGQSSGFWSLPEPVLDFHQSPIFYAPLLITMSIFLAYRFARTNLTLMTMNTQLEERVFERTKQYEEANTELTSANASLQEANARLQELDKMKSSFVSQASHDLRTPLTAIKGSLDNLILGVAGELNEKQNRVLNRAITSVNRLTDLINDVLDLNRIESGRVVLEKSDFNVCDAVKMMINENKPAAAEKEITLTAEGTSQSIMIHADRSKLERVIGECIGNAVKYTPNGGSVHVAVSIENAGQKPDMVCVSVKDSGMGLSKEDCSKVFERFYRVDAAKNTAKGSGLGLSIAKELVEMHEGKIEVESEVGQGTDFRLCLPIQLSNPK